MRIVISGSVGVGKSSLSEELGKVLGYEVIHLNELVEKYKLGEVPEKQTFDFDIDKFLEDFEKELIRKKNVIIESHFAHFINPKLIDYCFIVNRGLKELKLVYEKRGYNEEKSKDNLECESFNLCFYEAEENGFIEKKLKCFDNEKDLKSLVEKIEKEII